MTSSRIRRWIGLPMLALVSLALALSLVSQAAQGAKSKGQPVAFTGGVGHVRGTTVELEGTIKEATGYYFKYGPSSALGSQTPPAVAVAGSTAVKVAQTVTGFQVGYHYRLVATNNGGATVGVGKERVYGSAKSTTMKITLTRPPAAQQNLAGSPITISGVIAGAGFASQKIVLQATPYPYTEDFAAVAAAVSPDASGHFSFRVPSLKQNTQYRALTVAPRPVYSTVLTELASVRVTLHVRRSHDGGPVRLYGTISPAVVGAHVLFQVQKPATAPRRPSRSEKSEEKAELPKFSTRFATVAKRATKTVSRYSMVTTITTGGHYRAFVDLRKGALSSGYSALVLLHASPSGATKKGKHKG